MGKMTAFCLAVFLICVPAGVAQKKKEAATRSVSGVVTGANEKIVVGAVVQLTDTKTKQVRSFYTQEHGDYYFHGLSTDVDYELTASFRDPATSKDQMSGTKTLSVYDSRKDAVVNLKLNPPKQ